MALKKTKILSTGVSGEYWKIMSVDVQYPNTANVRLGLYLNKDARDSGKQPLLFEAFTLQFVGEADRTQLYTLIKQQIIINEYTDTNGNMAAETIPGFFVDAEDV